jgi:uncharacterized protein YndB with AHSA1/START domain
MRLGISMEELFGVPIDRVWHALTDPGMIERPAHHKGGNGND